MERKERNRLATMTDRLTKTLIGVMLFTLLFPFNLFSATITPRAQRHGHRAAAVSVESDTVAAVDGAGTLLVERLDSISPDKTLTEQPVEADSVEARVDTLGLGDREAAAIDTTSVVVVKEKPEWEERQVEFNPDPTKAVWLSALFPGLGQIYNRRYWKLPIIVGGYMGLGYATSWNNGVLKDYTRAYNDIMDNDPSTKSYMDFFPSTTKEEDLDKTWLTNTLKSRKDFYRRNRDLCIIGMVGVYLLAMVDAYVDASLSHFDISPDLSMDVAPAMIPDDRNRFPSVGLQWAINF